MSNLILRLQKDVFDPHGEQILYMAHCVKTSGKQQQAKDLFLCIINDATQSHLSVKVSEVKGGEKPASGAADQQPLKKKRSWALREIKAIDGKWTPPNNDDAAKNVPQVPPSADFELEFEKVYSWTAISIEEKTRFLSNLIKLTAQHLPRHKLSLIRVDPSILEVKLPSGSRGDDRKASWTLQPKDEPDSVYQIMTEKETSDLLSMMKKCDTAVTNAESFVVDLTKELNVLDGANIHSIMASEDNIDRLMDLLDKAIGEAETHEERLNQYDDLLEHIRDSMDKMEGKTVSIETVNLNNKKLLKQLEAIVAQLDIPFKHQQMLKEGDLTQAQLLDDAIGAAWVLQKALDYNMDPSLLKLAAVQDQRKLCEKWRDKFAKSIYRHLNNLFIHLSNEGDQNLEHAGDQLKLTRRRRIHQELIKYSELVHWLKLMDTKNFLSLQSIYRKSLCNLYEKDMHRFFDSARFRISGGKPIGQSVTASSQDVSGGRKNRGLLGADTDSIGSELSLSERERFDDIFETMLLELEAVCYDEQNFSIRFFKMDEPSLDPNCPKLDAKREKHATEESRRMMAEIFPTLHEHLNVFISNYERADGFFSLHALVRLSKHVLSAQDKGSFLAVSLGSVLIIIKRNFETFMRSQQKSIEEARAPRKTKCGILPFISNFEGFITTTENIFRGSERRVDLEKWYGSLVAEMSNSINRISVEHSKTPAEVVKMENYHHLHALLFQMKISVLDANRKEAKQRYQDALKTYVTQYFGRPLEKLTEFFDGIQSRVAAGVKESEISYQLKYSKQELRKVINAYPGREVRRGLDALYKKVERHLCEEEGLVQVVWREMQDEFIKQYKCIEDLIARCYPGSQIALDFAINDVLEYFSDIARSH